MPVGATVQLLGQTQSGFVKVRYVAHEGWAYASYLDLPNAPDNTARTTALLNLRSGAGTSFPVLLVIPSGSTVIITGTIQNGFMPVTYQGTAGWAFASYLSGSQVRAARYPSEINICLPHPHHAGDYQVTAAQLEPSSRGCGPTVSNRSLPGPARLHQHRRRPANEASHDHDR